MSREKELFRHFCHLFRNLCPFLSTFLPFFLTFVIFLDSLSFFRHFCHFFHNVCPFHQHFCHFFDIYAPFFDTFVVFPDVFVVICSSSLIIWTCGAPSIRCRHHRPPCVQNPLRPRLTKRAAPCLCAVMKYILFVQPGVSE